MADGLLLAERHNGEELAFTWDQALALPQVLGTSNGLRSLYGLQRLGVYQNDGWFYPQTDALGSVRQWMDAQGTVLGLQGYGPYGEALVPLGPPLAPWGYTGEWEDASGLVYLRARWYNPTWGRFTQVDRVAGALSLPATRHPYAYGLNDPLLYTDPSGEVPPILVALGIGVGTGAAIGAVGGGLNSVLKNPGRSIAEYARDGAFWRSVGVGAASGVVAALVAVGVTALLPAGAGFWTTVGVGAASGALASGAGQITANALTPCTPWGENVLAVMAWGGVAGGVTSGIAYGLTQWWAGRGLPREWHHWASDKNKTCTPRFQQILRRYGLSLEDDWNKALMPQRGRHPNDYHEFVLRGMRKAADEAGSEARLFLRLFDRYVVQPVRRNPQMLRKAGWQ
ncbi:MAG: RHS repeat-associated core domain-containing protein [Anaerolineae bacterium]